MNKWEVDEHKQWSEKVRSQPFCSLLLDKDRNYEGIWSIKRKSFVKPVGMNGSNFRNEALFVSFTAIIFIVPIWWLYFNSLEWIFKAGSFDYLLIRDLPINWG